MGRSAKVINCLGLLLVMGAMAGVIYHFRDELTAFGRRGAAELLPCAVPIRYSLEQFDTRFGLDRQRFLAVTAEAAKTWSDAVGKPILTYADGGELKINLIYDSRQAATDRLKAMGLSIDSGKGTYDALKAKEVALKAEVDRLKAAYETQVAAYGKRGDAYEAEVKSWNDKGGAPKAVFDRLNAEKQALDAEAAALKDQNLRLNAAIDDLNSVVSVLNRIASDLNLKAEQFNQTAQSRGEKFQEGEYVQENGATRIDIYEFENETMLKRVMMHELGHALGLEHLPDPKAVMYELNTVRTAELSEADKQAIRTRCGVK